MKNEAEQAIERKQIHKRFSIDRNGTLYRVEVYKDDKFSGMVLVQFGDAMAKNLSSQKVQTKQSDGKS